MTLIPKQDSLKWLQDAWKIPNPLIKGVLSKMNIDDTKLATMCYAGLVAATDVSGYWITDEEGLGIGLLNDTLDIVDTVDPDLGDKGYRPGVSRCVPGKEGDIAGSNKEGIAGEGRGVR